LGQGNHAGLGNQPHYTLQAYEQLAIAATQAWRELPTKGNKSQKITKILQGPEEPFQDFVARLMQHIGRTVGNPETGTILTWQLAFENANKHCEEAFCPYRKKAL
jgi:hypothetical protein